MRRVGVAARRVAVAARSVAVAARSAMVAARSATVAQRNATGADCKARERRERARGVRREAVGTLCRSPNAHLRAGACRRSAVASRQGVVQTSTQTPSASGRIPATHGAIESDRLRMRPENGPQCVGDDGSDSRANEADASGTSMRRIGRMAVWWGARVPARHCPVYPIGRRHLRPLKREKSLSFVIRFAPVLDCQRRVPRVGHEIADGAGFAEQSGEEFPVTRSGCDNDGVRRGTDPGHKVERDASEQCANRRAPPAGTRADAMAVCMETRRLRSARPSRP